MGEFHCEWRMDSFRKATATAAATATPTTTANTAATSEKIITRDTAHQLLRRGGGLAHQVSGV